jgi:hypothetical protein
MKNEIRPFRQGNSCELLAGIFGIEQAEFNPFAMLAKKREIRSFAVPGCAKRVRVTLPEPEGIHA